MFGPFVARGRARESNVGNARNRPLATAGFGVQVEVWADGFDDAISRPVGFVGNREKRRLTNSSDADTVHRAVDWATARSTAQFWRWTDDLVAAHARAYRK